MSRLISNIIRLAVINKVDYDSGIAYTKWLDQNGEVGPTVSIPHPYPGQKGEGIFAGIRKGNVIALGMLSNERYFPIAVIPFIATCGDLTQLEESNFDDIGFPYLKGGDIVIQGTTGGKLRFDNSGDISLSTAFGEGIVYNGNVNDTTRCSIATFSPVAYNVSNSGTSAIGFVRRDVRSREGQNEFADYLLDPDVEKVLEEIGWDASKRVILITRMPTCEGTDGNDQRFKNPAIIEDRHLLLEYGRDWYVKDFGKELNMFENSNISFEDSANRSLRRNNVLGLSQNNPNELIEKISGTVVDIFGNLLTINENILPTPTGQKAKDVLKDIFEINRHTIAFHMEINTKKGYSYREVDSNTKKPTLLTSSPDINVSANNARDRSRWALNIDKEGLTTINIPATSETGNVPLLTRKETSSVLNVDEKGNILGQRDDSDGLYRNAKNQDIFHDQFGPGGIEIVGSSINQIENRLQGNKTSWEGNSPKTLKKYVEAGTAFHDITQTAISLLQNNINMVAANIFNEGDIKQDLMAVASQINIGVPKDGDYIAERDLTTGLPKEQPNAGGRSAQINLDGSLEMSIGANTVDRVSWIIDTAGALVARLGRDRQGRSAIIQTDGTIALEIGGFDFIGNNDDGTDLRFVGKGEERGAALPGDVKQFKSGKMVIKLKRANSSQTGPDSDETCLIFDETGVTIQTAGRLNFVSKQDMVFNSESRILIEAPIVQVYEDNPRFIIRDGRII